jgi:hypothetical protein
VVVGVSDEGEGEGDAVVRGPKVETVILLGTAQTK